MRGNNTMLRREEVVLYFRGRVWKHETSMSPLAPPFRQSIARCRGFHRRGWNQRAFCFYRSIPDRTHRVSSEPDWAAVEKTPGIGNTTNASEPAFHEGLGYLYGPSGEIAMRGKRIVGLRAIWEGRGFVSFPSGME